MSSAFSRIKPWQWALLAVVIRLIAAGTQANLAYPDEWFQTVEFGNFIAHGFQARTQEFVLHLRNLTWPMMIAGALHFSDWLAPGDLFARFYSVKVLTAALDLLPLWALHQILISRSDFDERWRGAAWAAFVLPWAWVSESVRPSMEHLSSIAFWVGLGALARASLKEGRHHSSFSWSAIAGVSFVLTGAFRYPSGLLGLGAWGAAFIAGKRPVSRLGLLGGAVMGLALGGAADWIYYGRPWESLWMYLQYNVLTGLGSSVFGEQSALVYWTYFAGLFKGPLRPLLIPFLCLASVGVYRGIREKSPWAIGLLFFLVGHCLISHKESRFMGAIGLLVAWSALVGALESRRFFSRLGPILSTGAPRRIAYFGIVAVLGINFVFTLVALRGEYWKLNSNYFELSDLLRRESKVCAVLSARRPWPALIPWKSPERVPEPAYGYLPSEKEVIWIGGPPICSSDAVVLLQPRQAGPFYEELGCTLEKSGAMRWLSASQIQNAIGRGWIKGAWYRCQTRVLAAYHGSEVRDALARRLLKLERLPRIGISGEEFLRASWQGLDWKKQPDGSFSDR